MYLLDTNVISELRKPSAARTAFRADRNVLTWIKGIPPASQFLSAISILELEIGTLQMERRDPRQGAVLRTWFENHVLPALDGHILPVDLAVARRCAFLHIPNPCSDRDALIAATALVHGLTLVTRNVSDFQATGVAILNPWER